MYVYMYFNILLYTTHNPQSFFEGNEKYRNVKNKRIEMQKGNFWEDRERECFLHSPQTYPLSIFVLFLPFFFHCTKFGLLLLFSVS